MGGRPENLLSGNLVTFLYKTITCQTKYATPLQRGICNTCQTTSQDLQTSGHSPKQKPLGNNSEGEKWKTENKTYENLQNNLFFRFNQLINYFNQFSKTNIVVFSFNDIKVLC